MVPVSYGYLPVGGATGGGKTPFTKVNDSTLQTASGMKVMIIKGGIEQQTVKFT